MENEQVEQVKQEVQTAPWRPRIGGEERTADWYWIIYRYRASRFLVWVWSHFRQ